MQAKSIVYEKSGRLQRIAQSPDGRLLLRWCLAGLILRLAALPFAMTTEADAVSRIHGAQLWMADPGIITRSVWGPLHYYLIALSLLLYPDPAYGPALLNIFFCVATVPLLYFFVKEEFDAAAAAFIPCFYLCCPIVFQTSLMALAEIPCAFFLAATMLCLSRATKSPFPNRFSIAAGIALTLAAMLRYEAWLLIPAFAAVLWRRPRQQALFCLAALLFPVFWVSCSWLATGDPLQGIRGNEAWLFLHEGVRKSEALAEVMRRGIAFHRAAAESVTPLLCAGAVCGLLPAAKRKKKLLWAIPCCALYGAFLWKAAEGSMLLRGRYFIALLLLCLPFAAYAGACLCRRGVRKSVVTGAVAGFFLLCCCLPLLPPGAAARIPGGLFPVPRLSGGDKRIAEKLREHIRDKEPALVCDFFGWDRTFYAVLMTRLAPQKIFIFPGAQNDSLDTALLQAFLVKNPDGLLLLRESSRGAHALRQYQQQQPHLILKLQETLEDLSLYAYRYAGAARGQGGRGNEKKY